MKRIGLAITTALLAIVVIAIPVLAIGLPNSTPTVDNIYIFRNVLETTGTGDLLIIVLENTPYTPTPTDFSYDEAYIWRLIDTDGTTELAQIKGYPYDHDGYGYNVVSFYLNSANCTAKGINTSDALFLKLSGTPAAFATPPSYIYNISPGDYSSLTDMDEVRAEISNVIIDLATFLNSEWAVANTYPLIQDSETGVVLSTFGQSFFRGAIYGVQAMAPGAFALQISDIDTANRTWTTTHITTLETQHTGNYIAPALVAGEALLDVDYNLFGLMLTLAICMVIILGHWYLKGGNIWTGLVESAPPMIILTRMGMMGLGELALIASICWLFVSAKMWRIF